MTYQRYRILLERLFGKVASPAEMADLHDWLYSTKGHEEFDEMCYPIWVNALTTANESREADMLKAIKLQIADAEHTEAAGRPLHAIVYKVAAMIFFVVSIGLAGYLYHVRSQLHLAYDETTETFVDNGQKAHLILPDGTKVWLNSATKISYSGAYNHSERKVKLNGEAYFEVVKNKGKRFVVSCDGVNVEALGTTFNVKAYQNDPTVVASLIEGKVRISDATGSDVTLSPNQQLVYSRHAKTFAISNIDDMHEVDYWRKNLLHFKSTSLGHIAQTLERMYGVHIEFADDGIRSASFSGTIGNTSIENVLHIISLTYPLNYEFRKDTVILSAKY